LSAKNFLLIIALGFCWGPAFMFMMIGLDSFPPITIATLRVSIGALLIYITMRLCGNRLRPHLKHWKHFAVMGFFASALPFCLFPYAEKLIPSSLAGIINGTTPIFTAILAHYTLHDDRFTFRKVMGIITGVTGLVIIFLPSLIDEKIGNEWGMLFAIAATICYAIAMCYARRHACSMPFLVAPTGQLLFAALFLIPTCLIFDRPFALAAPTTNSIAAIIALGTISTAFTFALYYNVIKRVGASYLSMSTLLFPIVAIALGYLFLGETLTWVTFLGAALIISGLFISSPLLKK